MKIVDRKTFLAMPAGTLFSKYEPEVFGELCIKDESMPEINDFIYQEIVNSIKCNGSFDMHLILNDAEKKGTSFQLDFDCTSRDGLFDSDQLFAVWEQNDVKALIDRLQEALNSYGN